MTQKLKDIIKPEGYKPLLGVRETERAIKFLKDLFEDELAKALNLERVSAPLFVKHCSGLNDNLSGVERAVSFDIPYLNLTAEIVHSLAKWKRSALGRYGFNPGEGIYTDMNAIRREEHLDNLHSIYVDQWDWELVINKSDRNEETLKSIVEKIYSVFLIVAKAVHKRYPHLKHRLPENITFITTQELEDRYPDISPKEREELIAEETGAVFIMKIGGKLRSGEVHDKRAPDYDDWDLNGDIIFWYPLLNKSMELSSMGIRVDEESLLRQLEIAGDLEKTKLDFHRSLLEGKLPYTVGGGIGQSRLCMFFLEKAHIGEVQASIWGDEIIRECEKSNIFLL